MKEKEWKALIDKNTYDKLLLEKWDKDFIQINFYYSNRRLVENRNITIRIRCINSIMMLQVKVKTKTEDNITISDEYEKNIDLIPYKITEDEIKQIWNEYCFGQIELLGFLITERRSKQIGSIEVALDRNMYNGVTDYEIEFEHKDFCKEFQEDIDLVNKIKLDKKIQTGQGKYNRFISTLK